jgi:hypothetical protein
MIFCYGSPSCLREQASIEITRCNVYAMIGQLRMLEAASNGSSRNQGKLLRGRHWGLRPHSNHLSFRTKIAVVVMVLETITKIQGGLF